MFIHVLKLPILLFSWANNVSVGSEGKGPKDREGVVRTVVMQLRSGTSRKGNEEGHGRLSTLTFYN